MRETLYNVVARDPDTGDTLTMTGHWRSLTYERRVNFAGSSQISVYADDDLAGNFDADVFLDIWRKYYGGSWYRDFTTLHRGLERETTETGLELVTGYQRGLLDLIARRVIQGYAGTAYTQKSGVAETVLKEFVDEQCVSGAIYRSITGLSIEADGAGGNSIAPEVAWRELLEVLQEFAGDVGGGDFGIDLDSDYANTFTFKWYDDQFGLDRTWGNGVNDPMIFSTKRGNVRNMMYKKSRLGEVTAVVVGGQGDGVGRAIVTRTNAAAIADSPWNRIETFLNMSNLTGATELNDAGDAELDQGQFVEMLECNVLLNGNAVYGRDFDLGDLVTIENDGYQVDKKIVAVRVTVNQDGEQVSLEMADVP